MNIDIYFDGACEPVNPGGYGACGFIVTVDGEEHAGSVGLGRSPEMTNNRAEWCALGFALRRASELVPGGRCGRLRIYGDSMLVVNQVTGQWRCNQPHLARLRDRVLALIDGLAPSEWTVEWIPRAQNDRADALSRAAYREQAA